MFRPRRTPLLASLFLLSVPLLHAEAADPSGHWEGTIQAPKMEVRIEVDLAKNSKGELTGTFSHPAKNMMGYPLSDVAVEGKSIRFGLKAGSKGEKFKGALSADGKSMSGDFTTATPDGDVSLPFSLTRTGNARIETPVKNPRIGKELEGAWNGTLDVEGKQLRLILKMSNQPDGSSTGTLVSLDQGAVEIPVTTIAQKAPHLNLEVKTIGGSYSGDLSAAGTELVGTWTQGALALPLTFRRAVATKDK